MRNTQMEYLKMAPRGLLSTALFSVPWSCAASLTSHSHNFPMKPQFCSKNRISSEMWKMDKALQHVKRRRGWEFMGGWVRCAGSLASRRAALVQVKYYGWVSWVLGSACGPITAERPHKETIYFHLKHCASRAVFVHSSCHTWTCLNFTLCLLWLLR